MYLGPGRTEYPSAPLRPQRHTDFSTIKYVWDHRWNVYKWIWLKCTWGWDARSALMRPYPQRHTDFYIKMTYNIKRYKTEPYNPTHTHGHACMYTGIRNISCKFTTRKCLIPQGTIYNNNNSYPYCSKYMQEGKNCIKSWVNTLDHGTVISWICMNIFVCCPKYPI